MLFFSQPPPDTFLIAASYTPRLYPYSALSSRSSPPPPPPPPSFTEPIGASEGRIHQTNKRGGFSAGSATTLQPAALAAPQSDSSSVIRTDQSASRGSASSSSGSVANSAPAPAKGFFDNRGRLEKNPRESEKNAVGPFSQRASDRDNLSRTLDVRQASARSTLASQMPAAKASRGPVSAAATAQDAAPASTISAGGEPPPPQPCSQPRFRLGPPASSSALRKRPASPTRETYGDGDVPEQVDSGTNFVPGGDSDHGGSKRSVEPPDGMPMKDVQTSDNRQPSVAVTGAAEASRRGKRGCPVVGQGTPAMRGIDGREGGGRFGLSGRDGGGRGSQPLSENEVRAREVSQLGIERLSGGPMRGGKQARKHAEGGRVVEYYME